MLIIAAIGFFLGGAAFSALVRWVALVYSALSQDRTESERSERPSPVVVAICQSLFHAGPWSVATVAFVAYCIRAEPWAPWLFGGFGASFVLFGITIIPIALRLRNANRRGSNANAV
jgi:hypothetical protein